MQPLIKRLLTLAGVVGLCSSASAGGFIDDVIDTLPAGYVAPADSHVRSTGEYWNDTVEATKAIMENGRTMWIFPTYTAHPEYHWDNKPEQNAAPFGMGIGRMAIDDKGNERTLFLVNFIDSNYRLEPTWGYQWIARKPLGDSGLHVGAGYLAGLSMRADYHWIPFPMVLPVGKIGTDEFSVYGTYIPVLDVGFVYTVITLDDTKNRRGPLPSTSAWHDKHNFLRVGAGWEYIDNGAEENTPHWATNHGSWHAGLRHYSGRNWATDLSYRHSKHLFRSPGNVRQTYKFDNVSLQIQYNIDATDNMRLYTGGGIGWSRMKGPKHKDTSIHPVMSMGATYALTRDVFLNADMTVMLSRFTGVLEAAERNYTVRAMPTDFSLSIGCAF